MTAPTPVPPVRWDNMLDAPADKLTRTSVTLVWKKHRADPFFRVERRQGADPYDIIAIVPGPVFVDPDCDPASVYEYRVTAMLDDPLPNLFDLIQAQTKPATIYPDEMKFFTEYLRPMFLRYADGGPGVDWCPKWHEHREAHKVVREMWRSWEAHRPPDDPDEPGNEQAQWLIVYAYPMWERLWAKQTVFRGCRWADHHPTNEQLPHS